MANQLYDSHDVVTHVYWVAPIVLQQARLAYNFQIVTNAFDHIIIFYFSLIITLVIPMANTACVLTLARANYYHKQAQQMG